MDMFYRKTGGHVLDKDRWACPAERWVGLSYRKIRGCVLEDTRWACLTVVRRVCQGRQECLRVNVGVVSLERVCASLKTQIIFKKAHKNRIKLLEPFGFKGYNQSILVWI